MEHKVIVVATHFSRFPAGRYLNDGPNSGERFRDEILIKALRERSQVTVDLDGAAGYGSSFLEEAFGGLIRASSFTLDDVKQRLTIKSDDSSLTKEIWEYMQDAAEHVTTH